MYLGYEAGSDGRAGGAQHEAAKVFTAGVQFQTDRSIYLDLYHSAGVLDKASVTSTHLSHQPRTPLTVSTLYYKRL